MSLALICSLAAPGRAQLHSDEGASFHNTTFLKVDDQARQYLLEAELAAERHDVEKAATALRRLLLSDVDSLLPQSERMLRDAREVAALKLLELGEPAVAQYRKLADEPAQVALKAALNPPSSAQLGQVVLAYPLAPARATALEALGDLAREAGRVGAASYYYRALLRDPNLPAERRATVRAKAMLASGVTNQQKTAAADASVVQVAGAPMPLAQLASQLSQKTAAEPRFAALLDGAEHAGHVPQLPAKLGLVASGQLRLPARDANEELVRLWGERLLTSTSLPPSPIIVRDRVYFAGRDALWFFELASGRPLHEPIRYDSEASIDERERVQAGSPAITAGDRELYLTLNTERTEDDQRGFVAAYDLTSGARLWALSLDDPANPPAELQGLAVAGPPIVLDDRLYVSAARLTGGDTESYVLGLNAHTGQLEYLRFICSATYVPRYGERFSGARPKLVLGAPLSAHDGVLYSATNLGVVAAVAAESGRILWAFKYNRINPQDPGQYLHYNLYDAGPWPPTPVMIAYDRVHVAPADSEYLYVLDLFPDPRGFIMLGDPIERDVPDRLIAVTEDQLILQATVTRTYRLMATDLLGTEQHKAPAFLPDEKLAGYPLLSGTTLLYPTTRDIYWVSLKDGIVIERGSGLPWRVPDEQPGTLAAAGDYVACQSATGYFIFRRQ
ncbi:MAG: PQQ-binding-like beta-propeller repeat protein [Planctomycetota bacterium]